MIFLITSYLIRLFVLSIEPFELWKRKEADRIDLPLSMLPIFFLGYFTITFLTSVPTLINWNPFADSVNLLSPSVATVELMRDPEAL